MKRWNTTNCNIDCLGWEEKCELTCLCLALVHGELFLLYSLQLGSDAELRGLKIKYEYKLKFSSEQRLTFFWSLANLFSYFDTFFSVGLMLRRREHICLLVLKLSLIAQQIIQGVFFTAPALTVLSVEDCRIPNKKVKVGRAFPFLVSDFAIFNT